MDLSEFEEEVGSSGPVTIAGLATRGGPVDGVRTVMAPVGIDWIQPDEMTLQWGAGTPVEEVDAALAAHGQCVAIPRISPFRMTAEPELPGVASTVWLKSRPLQEATEPLDVCWTWLTTHSVSEP